MKTMDEVDRIHLLKDLWKTFREGLETQLDETLTARVDTTNSGRIDAEILWNSLERCKHPLAVNLGCHHHDLFCRAEPITGTSWESMSSVNHGWLMREFMLDFSITMGAIPVVIGQATEPRLPSDEKYEILLGVESEMGSRNEVLRDLLKLLDVKARVKILLYNSRVYKKHINNLKRDIEFVFNRHASVPTDDLWLIAGIPSYATWAQHTNNRIHIPRQIYTLSKVNYKNYELTSVVDDWWSFEDRD
ncbi:hypothetical protein [Gimesia chilikensis]|uniref:Uncharacterized protein n=1 Tax=Gimesia chilikensis TaxID=2605989 RepID=A0A517PRP2_9PLAN|nr:hypothetical protein [Gimesia chilikensis]QDT22031.1 hypothetical protein HG66A1_38370 [Gimesia chilikensis]